MARALFATRQDDSTWPDARPPLSTASDNLIGVQLLSTALRMPFDLMRTQHAQAVRAGLLNRSILESREFEKRVHALEHFWLGPFAREV